ncbi:MAG: hypothetical protein HYY62_05940 [Deltaproteobacteria bacterium]|nr:hypothetical protein [Deltaproteobacteria bacterium]
MKKIFFIVFGMLIFSGAWAGEGSPTQAKKLSLTTDFQWISGANEVKGSLVDSSTQLGRLHLGAKYVFSDISHFTANFPIAMSWTKNNYSILSPVASQLTTTRVMSDRLKLGIEGKLFRETAFGEVSWNSAVYLPTILGKVDFQNRFYNHTALTVGLSNIHYFANSPAFALGSFSYITKFPTTYQKEERDYGDEFAMTVGAGYRIARSIHPMVKFQASYVKPFKTTLGEMFVLPNETTSAAVALHAMPGFSVSLNDNLALRGVSRILLYRSKIEGQDSGAQWGNFEDESKISVLLGVRLGLF